MTSRLEKLAIHHQLYDQETPLGVIRFFENEILEMERHPNVADRMRWALTYGDVTTGLAAREEHDNSIMRDAGYVVLLPIEQSPGFRFGLQWSATSTNRIRGVMLSRIVKIAPSSRGRRGGRPVYRHPFYHEDRVPASDADEPEARIRSAARQVRAARRLIATPGDNA